MDIANSLFGGRRVGWHARILAGAALALVLAAPGGAFGQEPSDAPANFNERYPAEQLPTQPPSRECAGKQAAKAPVNAGTTQEQTGSTQPQPQSVSERAERSSETTGCLSQGARGASKRAKRSRKKRRSRRRAK